MFTREFWNAAGERAIRTVAQSLLGVAFVEGANLASVDWQAAAGIAGAAGIASILMSVVATKHGTDNGPSFGPESLS